MAFERETNEIEVPEREGLEQKGLETGAKDLEDSDLGSVNLEELDFDEGDAEESEPADDEVQASELNHHNMDELSSDPDLDEADEDALDGTALAGDAEAGLPVEEETSAADEIADGGDPFEDVLPVEDETSTADEIAGGGAPVEDTLPTEGDEDDRVPEYFEPEGIMLVQNSRAPEAETVQPDESRQLQDAEPQTPQQLENVQPDESRQLENDQTVESTTQQEVQPETTQAMEPTIEDRTSVQSMEMSGIIARDGENGKNEVQVDIRDEAAVRKAYRDEILYTNPDNRTFDKQLANLEERQNDLEGQIGRLEEKADQLKKEGKEDSKEYENTNKALDKAKSDLDENKTQQKLIRDTISDVKETEGLKRADQIAEQGKKDAPLKLDETYAKRSERYLENARDVVKDKIEALEKERKTLGSEGKERRAQIDAELNGAKKNLVKLEYSLARVKESIVAKEMKEIKAITDKIDRAKGKRAEKLKEKYITPEFRAKVERTVQRRKDAVALARSVEEANYIPPRVDSEDKSVETADKKQFAEDKVKAGHLATRMINAEKTVDQIRETAMSYTPHVENDDAKKRMAMYDAAMAGVKVIKDALYDPKQVADSLKEMKDATVDAYESINDENALVNEEQEKDNETLKDLEEGLREAEAGDPFKLSVAVSDITLDAIASSKDGGILNLETDRDRSYFEKFRECQKSAVELYQSAKDLAGSLVNPGKWPEVVKNLAQMSDKVFNVEDKAKAWIGTLLEDRYGKNYGADTDFASKFDRSLYEWVSRPDSKFERFVHYAATTSDALSGMGEQYKKFL